MKKNNPYIKKSPNMGHPIMTIDEYVKLALAKSNMPSLNEMFTTFYKNSKF
jgi:hypothetical protein